MRAWFVLLVACSGDAPDPDGGICGDGTTASLELCDDGNTANGDGCDDHCLTETEFRATWAFYPTVDGPEQLECRAGVREIEVVTDRDVAERFACADRTGTVSSGTTSRVLVRLRGANDDIIAESLPSNSASARYAFYEDAGFLRASLPIEGLCDIITLTLRSGATQQTQALDCLDRMNTASSDITSDPIRAGVYDIELATTTNQRWTRAGVVVGDNNRVTDLAF